MQYETVYLDRAKIIGICAQTSNSAPDMGGVIGSLWQRFFEGGEIKRIPNPVSMAAICLYSDYSAADTAQNLRYSVTVGLRAADGGDIPEGMAKKMIPAGRYAKFTAHGDMVSAVAEAWSKIWATPLERSFSGDFEEYTSCNESGCCDVNIYVALK